MSISIPFGAPAWVDSMTPDLAADVAFYSGLFGWKAADGGAEWGHYTELRIGETAEDGRSIGGIVPNDSERGDAPGEWNLYFLVEDCAAKAAEAEKLGARITVAPMDIGDLIFSMVQDPNGAVFGLFQAKSDEMGFKAFAEPNAPMWFEYSYDGVPAEAMKFYADLLGWDVITPPWEDPNNPRPYAALRADGAEQEFGGCHPAEGPEKDLPPQWVTMILVEDADATCAKAAELGGKVVAEPTDVPQTRIAGVQSPTGATLGVMAPR
ncbi:VOC family protein [Glycomyces buryatensis]|uniref:VOC family protein n=1 Tax=Glycomyces buryatensis TaxID=2570927 RepID=A0A4S8QGH7_9ACTN|nr:VOC family protein [Glycomyces buryatensis]THV42821.1 VOC family protein [Glycomyces buryatensis]